MTVAQQIQQTIATMKSVQASFELFSYETKDEEAQKAFETAFKDSDQIITSLETRLMQVEKEEPQYKSNVLKPKNQS